MNSRSFASDNNAGVHPEVIDALKNANQGHVIAYGDDPYTEAAGNKLKRIFGGDVEVFFVYNGTGANVLGLSSVLDSYQAVICADTAHIQTDECGAPEKFTGCKLLTVPTADGKLTIEGISKHMHGIGFEHHVQPRVISITQATEMGTLYTPMEIREIVDYAHKNKMFLHMDGARIANAAVALELGFADFTARTGVDILSFGGTKNGLMFGEAVIFFNRRLADNFKYIRKQGMQLASKMRYISAQFNAYLENDLWRKSAQHANAMARLLASEVEKIPQIKITQKVQANGIFAIVPPEIIPALQQEYFFYIWNEETSEVRWMCSFDTTEEDIQKFVAKIRQCLS